MYLDSIEGRPRLTSVSFPRTRGDVPFLEYRETGLLMDVSPAHAGMYLFVDWEIDVGCLSFPPHTRGCTPADGVLEVRRAGLVSPAHAGMYPAIAESIDW